MLGAVLAGMVACSFVLDAFEMIFLVVPIVMPPVLSVVPDAAWVAALTLLVLQLGFLLPPLGYAVVMSRAALRAAPPLPALARALAPQLAAQMLLVVVLLAWPGLTRLGRDGPESAVAPAVSAEQAERMMDEQFGRNRGAADPADPAASEPTLEAGRLAVAARVARRDVALDGRIAEAPDELAGAEVLVAVLDHLDLVAALDQAGRRSRRHRRLDVDLEAVR